MFEFLKKFWKWNMKTNGFFINRIIVTIVIGTLFAAWFFIDAFLLGNLNNWIS